MIAPFANLFGYILNFIYNVVNNYGIAIIIFSILIKLAMLPISIKQQKTMKKTTKIQNKMKEIQFKYKNDPENLNRATMELYKSENMSPFSGCFSAIVQIILLFAVFYLVRSPLTYMKKVDSEVISKYTKIMQQNELTTSSAYPEIEIIRDIDKIKELRTKEEQAQDGTEENSEQVEDNSQNEDEKINLTEINDEELDSLNINMEFLGLNLAQVPTNTTDWKAYIIPLLYVLVSIISLRLTNPTKNKKKNDDKDNNKEEFDPMVQMNKNINIIFPIMYLSVALIAPLGLALYWLTNSLLMIVEKLTLNKVLKDEEE